MEYKITWKDKDGNETSEVRTSIGPTDKLLPVLDLGWQQGKPITVADREDKIVEYKVETVTP